MKELGAPTAHVFFGLMTFLSKADVGEANKAKIAVALDQLKSEDQKTVETTINYCVLERCADDEKVKIIIAMAGFPDRATVIASLAQIGFEKLVGVAQAGHLENELQCWADYLKSRK